MSKSEPIRRVVTGHDESNRSVFVTDGPVERVFDNLGQPGLVFHEVWHTTETPARIDRDQAEADEPSLLLSPPPNGVRIRVVDLPPDSVGGDLDAVFENIGASHEKVDSGRHAAFHRTETVDFGIVLSGEIVLLLDEGETTVGAGDIVVQRGTNHGWANRSNEPCRIAFILIDGKFVDGLE